MDDNMRERKNCGMIAIIIGLALLLVMISFGGAAVYGVVKTIAGI